MNASLPLLLIIAAMLLLVGILAIAAIVLIAKNCGRRPDNKKGPRNDANKNVDVWLESAKRLEDKHPEQES